VLTAVGIKYNRKNQQVKTVVIPIILDRIVPMIVPMEKKNSEINNIDRMKYKKYTFMGTYKPFIAINRSALPVMAKNTRNIITILENNMK
jgi:hypothetical protein